MFHVYSAFGWNVLKISMRSITSNISFKACVSSLIFCLNDLSIGVSGMLKSPSIIVLLWFLFLCLLVFVLSTEVHLWWMKRYLRFCLPLGLISWSLCSIFPFNILSLFLVFISVISMCLGLFLLGFTRMEFCTSWT